MLEPPDQAERQMFGDRLRSSYLAFGAWDRNHTFGKRKSLVLKSCDGLRRSSVAAATSVATCMFKVVRVSIHVYDLETNTSTS